MQWLLLLPLLLVGAGFTYLNLKHYVQKHDWLNKRAWTHNAPIWIVLVLFLFVLIPYQQAPALLGWIEYLKWLGYLVFGLSAIQHLVRWFGAIKKVEQEDASK